MKKYTNVEDQLGDLIMWNTLFKTLVGVNLGAFIAWDNEWVKLVVGLFGVVCLVGDRMTQKKIDLNTPSKAHVGDINQETK